MAALSSEVVTSEIVNVGPASSSVIVNIPVASLIDALLAFDKPKVITQSQKHIQKNMLKVVITEGKAYFILDNVFYVADAIDGRVNEETTRPLDTENMPTKELDKMLSILDDLKQGVGPNDSGSAGNERV